MVVVSRFAGYAASLHGFAFDELATVGHPVGKRMRDDQVADLNALWRRAARPLGDPRREGLPVERDRAWFASRFCGHQDLDSISDDRTIWAYVSMIPPHDALALLAAHPTTLEHFFEVEVKEVNGVQHLVVGTSDEVSGVRDSQQLRSFLIKALHYALSESLDDASRAAERLQVRWSGRG